MQIVSNSVNNKMNNQIQFKSNNSYLRKIINPKVIERKLKQINLSDERTKDVFMGLTALAASALAELSLLSKKNSEIKDFTNQVLKEFEPDDINSLKNIVTNLFSEEKTNNNTIPNGINLQELINQKPERNLYLALTSKYFPQLDAKYTELLTKSITEPNNKENKLNLDTLEDIFSVLTTDGLKYRKRYFDALNSDYINCFDNVCENYRSTVKNGDPPMYYLVMLHNGSISEQQINTWAKAKNLGRDEFLLIRNLDEDKAINLSKLKEENSNFKLEAFDKMNDKSGYTTYIFKLKFPEKIPLKQKLKTIADVHTALYGPIFFLESKDKISNFMITDIQHELLGNLVKDKTIDSVYSIVKYLQPDAFKNINISVYDSKFLTPKDKELKKIKKICSRVLMDITPENQKLQELCNVINDDSNFGDIITSRHAKLRFIARLVLKDNLNVDLAHDCKTKIAELESVMDSILEDKNIFCYLNSRGLAPQFYMNNRELGNYIKITLNSNGTIHTLFEDINKDANKPECNASNELEQ